MKTIGDPDIGQELRWAGILRPGEGFVDFHRAAGPVDVAGEIEAMFGGDVVKLGRRGGKVWVVGLERHPFIGFFETENEDGVVDGELGETEHVDDWRAFFFNLRN